MSENAIWKGRPSQWVNFMVFAICGLVVVGAAICAVWLWSWLWLLILPAVSWASWKYLEVRFRVYELTSERLRIYEGVLNQTIDELELYRVKDMTIERPFWLRIVGLGTLVLITSDRSHPELHIAAINDAMGLRDQMRTLVEGLRDRKRVREMDFSSDGEGGEFEEFDFE
ncbi:membrane protein YdbS, contains bPH2 (pleckstrin homology) domain [Rubritalea squalenifaciens DSM 18772]|uniref:Membrane protein YdbS, contains bPH2 (Pleckstrin homology) domain n=2 Tax=Rubritalea squalenifaciens TaxID=407226 RepID=A0A1M6I8Q8_9BACT|nr:membrane protein YdbS, contains bPH2 (pleckstrin homology) domain [Rubritalea squalenifaciens DSM 18772]